MRDGPERFGPRSLLATAALVLVLGLPPAAPGQTAGLPPRWVLIYAGGPPAYTQYPRYTVDDFTRLVAGVDSAGRPRAWLTTGALFLQLYAPSTHAFTDWIGGTPADGADWRSYVDTLLAPGGPVARLDSAVALVAATAGPLGRPYRLAFMIPYPASVDTLRYGGTLYRLKDASDGGALVAAYVQDVQGLFTIRGFPNVALDGFYWLHETMDKRDRSIAPAAAERVHKAGFRFLWIPYYGAAGWADWRRYGFDDAWLQANYFFELNLPTQRLDSTFARARGAGMGVELEFDSRLFGDPQYADRLLPYLTRLAAAPDARARAVAIYEGGGALLRLSHSTDAWHRALYRRFVTVLTSSDSLIAP